MKDSHFLEEKSVIGRQVAAIWIIVTLGAIVAATLVTVLTTYGINSEASIAISLITVGTIVVLIHLALYRTGYLPFRVLNTSALFYPLKVEDVLATGFTEGVKN